MSYGCLPHEILLVFILLLCLSLLKEPHSPPLAWHVSLTTCPSEKGPATCPTSRPPCSTTSSWGGSGGKGEGGDRWLRKASVRLLSMSLQHLCR